MVGGSPLEARWPKEFSEGGGFAAQSRGYEPLFDDPISGIDPSPQEFQPLFKDYQTREHLKNNNNLFCKISCEFRRSHVRNNSYVLDLDIVCASDSSEEVLGGFRVVAMLDEVVGDWDHDGG
ncbi:indole-3-glycerol phosphate synthase [Striga asiatica]|uniref:Indole-3-glycerol phosphate synthase n=1 Tax=Striga asiatica TaxID=4170 RepID=A0A5A7PUT2_STRAF|nr:indole-3-glycerol phosphate synthase [Striga asiatica]